MRYRQDRTLREQALFSAPCIDREAILRTFRAKRGDTEKQNAGGDKRFAKPNEPADH
jgi:hypothetical protein